jgi:hypothetical protein
MRKVDPMARSVEVTSAQRDAARYLVQRNEEKGIPSRPWVIAVAHARRNSEGRIIATDDAVERAS